MNNIEIPVSVGELIDKLTILEIKNKKINDENKLNHIKDELNLLKIKSENYLLDEQILRLYYELLSINNKLWGIEDIIRKKEKNMEFDVEFIEIARSVYKTNDLRFDIKNKINELTNSLLKEQKSY